jgi:hypothetical protein
MKKIHFVGIAFTFMTYLVSIPANATTSYSVTFYERTGSAFTNLFTDYVTSGKATFEINDSAVSPNNLVLFKDSDFLAFDASLTTTIGNARFTLGKDDFPPRGDDATTIIKHEQGILFDASGKPLRFDTPTTFASNAATICDPSCFESSRNRSSLTLLDEGRFDEVFLDDGTILSQDEALATGDTFTPLNGRWVFNPLNESVTHTIQDSYYLIEALPVSPAPAPEPTPAPAEPTPTPAEPAPAPAPAEPAPAPNPVPVSPSPVPIPSAVWLFGSGLFGLLGMARRKFYA